MNAAVLSTAMQGWGAIFLSSLKAKAIKENIKKKIKEKINEYNVSHRHEWQGKISE